MLPADRTSFVGRRHDVIAVRQLFSVSRLVTLTGIGEVGKNGYAAHDRRRLREAVRAMVCALRVADTSVLSTAPLRGPAGTAVLIGEVMAHAMRHELP